MEDIIVPYIMILRFLEDGAADSAAIVAREGVMMFMMILLTSAASPLLAMPSVVLSQRGGVRINLRIPHKGSGYSSLQIRDSSVIF